MELKVSAKGNLFVVLDVGTRELACMLTAQSINEKTLIIDEIKREEAEKQAKDQAESAPTVKAEK